MGFAISIGNGIGHTPSQGVGLVAPAGFAFLADNNGALLTDNAGSYIVVPLELVSFYDTTVADSVNYVDGSYYGYLSPWGAGTLTSPADYLDTMSIVSADFPNNTRIVTTWPTSSPPFGVWGYMAVNYGWYNGTVKPPGLVAPTPVQAGSFTAFREVFDWSYSGSSHFNLLNEFYLTTAAGVLSGKTHEISFFLHAPSETRTTRASKTAVGTYTDDQGRAWDVRKNTVSGYVFISFMPAGDILAGSINFKHALDWLVTQAQITGSEYVNGVGFGTEPTVTAGSTSLLINQFVVPSFS